MELLQTIPRSGHNAPRTLLLLLLLAVETLSAQVSTQDPMMTLMLSQPKIGPSGPVQATASFDPPQVRPGSMAYYRLNLNAMQDSVVWDGKPPAPADLELVPGAKGQILQMGTTNLEPLTSFVFRVQPEQAGDFTIPEFNLTVEGRAVKVPAATLQVSPGAPAASAQQLYVQMPSTNTYAGQAVTVRVILPSGTTNGALQGLAQVQLTGNGFIVDQTSARMRVETTATPLGPRPAYIYETTITPITAGKLSFLAQAFTIGNRFSGTIVLGGPVTLAGGAPQYDLIDSQPFEFRVKPLPRSGQLPGFTGMVGSYSVDPPKLASAELRVGDPVRMTVVVRGEGSLSRLVPPPVPKLPEWQVFLGTNDNLPPQILQAQGFARINYTLIPVSEQVTETPAIPFSCFDPVKGEYVDLTIRPVPVAVRAGAVPVDLGSLVQAGKSGSKESEPVLSDISGSLGVTSASLVPLQLRPWFHFVQLAPAALFLGLWGWDQRRRYLAANPGIVLRRKARRGLRRQRRLLRRAGRAGDPAGFVAAAANGMRAACAPHYPAEPRALVCADVVPILPEAERSGRTGEAVRRIFETSDASQFGGQAPEMWELLQLQPEIERVFASLRRKL